MSESADDKSRKFNFMVRAVYGELICSFIFFTLIYGQLANCYVGSFGGSQLNILNISLVQGLSAAAWLDPNKNKQTQL